MIEFANCELSPSHITLTLEGGISTYMIYGYAIVEEDDKGNKCVALYRPDAETIVMRVPYENVASLVCNL